MEYPHLREWYQKTQSENDSFTVPFPEEYGCGYMKRFRTPDGISTAFWEMKYRDDTDVKGKGGGDLRLLFNMGEGSSWNNEEGSEISLGTSEAIFSLNQGCTESMCYHKNADYSFSALYMDRMDFSNLLSRYVSSESVDSIMNAILKRPFSVTTEIQRMLESVKRMSPANNGIEMLRAEACVHEILAACLQRVLEEDVVFSRIHPDDAASIKNLAWKIDRDPASIPGIEELARSNGMSASKLTRLFRQVYGVPIHTYVIERRLTLAAELLTTGKMTVGEVADRVGYAKSSQFTSAFKRRFGILPKNY